MSRFPTMFAERNRVVIAVVSLAVMAALFVGALNASALPVIGGGTIRTAHFAEAGGLRPGDDVTVAGVEVGEVTDVSLDGDVVIVDFRIEGVTLTNRTRAAVKVGTLLGQKYLALNPGGTKPLEGPIPLSQTTTPYDVSEALSDLSTTVTEIDTAQLEKSLRVLTNTFKDTPESVRAMVDGLTALSRTISTRDQKLHRLFEATRQLSDTLASRNEEFAQIIQKGSKLLAMLERRRAAVEKFLQGTEQLAAQIKGLVRDNQEQLRPALEKLDQVSAILRRNQKHLNAALEKLGPYYRVLAAATGNGRWIDAYMCGLFDKQNHPLLKNDVKRNCHPGGNG